MWLTKKIVAMWMIVVFTTPLVLAEVPRIMTYQGRLTDTGGAPYSGTRIVVFKIYDGSGSMIWSSGAVTPTFVNGLITVELGKSPQPPLPTANWQTDTLLSLGIALPPDPELTPRHRFTTTGYAFTAKTADLASSIADNTVNSAKIVNGSILFQDLGNNGASEGNVIKMVGGQWAAGTDNTGPSSGWTDAGSTIYNTTLSDNVGIGTTTPRAKLEIVATGTQAGGLLTNSCPTFGYPALQVNGNGLHSALLLNNPVNVLPMITTAPCAVAAVSVAKQGYAGWFMSDSRNLGTVTSWNHADSGLALDADADDGVGALIRGKTGLECQGYGTTAARFETWSIDQLSQVIDAKYTGNSQQDHVAINGYSKPVDFYGVGGTFEGGYKGVLSVVYPSGSSTYYGIATGVTGGSGTNYGLHTAASGSGTNYGIYSTAYLGATNWAGYFDGDINVTGTVWKSKDGFRIDHPLDPTNRYLQHNSVESSEMKNIYDGVAVLDAGGKATVKLPDWFQALNGDYRYQLTCISGYAPVYVASEISNNQFEIAGGTPGLKVSWQVTGVRQDKFAQANRLQIEQEKLPTEKGRYLHPAVYGFGEEQSVTYDPERTPQDRAKQKVLRDNLAKAADERIPERPKPQTVKVTER